VSNKLTSVKRANLIARLKRLGFEGPFSGGKHQFLVRGPVRLILPNPHASDIGPSLLARISAAGRSEARRLGRDSL